MTDHEHERSDKGVIIPSLDNIAKADEQSTPHDNATQDSPEVIPGEVVRDDTNNQSPSYTEPLWAQPPEAANPPEPESHSGDVPDSGLFDPVTAEILERFLADQDPAQLPIDQTEEVTPQDVGYPPQPEVSIAHGYPQPPADNYIKPPQEQSPNSGKGRGKFVGLAAVVVAVSTIAYCGHRGGDEADAKPDQPGIAVVPPSSTTSHKPRPTSTDSQDNHDSNLKLGWQQLYNDKSSPAKSGPKDPKQTTKPKPTAHTIRKRGAPLPTSHSPKKHNADPSPKPKQTSSHQASDRHQSTSKPSPANKPSPTSTVPPAPPVQPPKPSPTETVSPSSSETYFPSSWQPPWDVKNKINNLVNNDKWAELVGRHPELNSYKDLDSIAAQSQLGSLTLNDLKRYYTSTRNVYANPNLANILGEPDYIDGQSVSNDEAADLFTNNTDNLLEHGVDTYQYDPDLSVVNLGYLNDSAVNLAKTKIKQAVSSGSSSGYAMPDESIVLMQQAYRLSDGTEVDMVATWSDYGASSTGQDVQKVRWNMLVPLNKSAANRFGIEDESFISVAVAETIVTSSLEATNPAPPRVPTPPTTEPGPRWPWGWGSESDDDDNDQHGHMEWPGGSDKWPHQLRQDAHQLDKHAKHLGKQLTKRVAPVSRHDFSWPWDD